MPTNNFDFKLVDEFLGYSSSRDKTNLNEKYLIRGSKNVYKKQSGTLASRFGLKRRGTADTTSAGVKSSYEWLTSWGDTRVLRVANGKLEVESDIIASGTYVWYTLQTLTLTRFIFDSVWDNTNKKAFLVFVRGDTNLFKWDGGLGKIVSSTANTIVLNDTIGALGFNPTSGSVVINGTTYTYSGTSGSTLTGVAADPTGEAVNSVVIQAIITNATTPDSTLVNDFLKVINNQVHVGGYNSQRIFISEDDNYIDYTVPSPRAPGDPELIFLDGVGQGIGASSGKAHISYGTSGWLKIEFQPITVGTTLTEQTIATPLETPNLGAALGHEYITNIGDAIAYLSQDQQLRILGIFTNVAQPKFATLSLPIKDELANQTFTPVQGDTSDGEVRAVGDKIYINSVTGGVTYLHETRESLDESGQVVAERFWQPPQIWGISRIAVIDGVEYGWSIANPQIYQLWDTDQWSDDSPSDEQMPYDSIARFAYRNHGRRQGMLTFDMIYYEGYMAQGTNLKGKLYADYQGSSSLQQLVLNKTDPPTKLAQFFTGFTSPSVGDSSLGENPLGEGLTEDELSQEQLPKFRKIKDITSVDCFEYSLEVYTDEVDSRWELLCLGTNATKSQRSPTFLR